ncbi:dUTP diphosphatase [Sporosarcina koreensis]|uniref:dUTP diphosphatase n=1 Tax=Sporosarcina koreensis TaxID=334735 RepID=UPI000755B206|nr:hypothetical protein [Sporosarcina koreensis]
MDAETAQAIEIALAKESRLQVGFKRLSPDAVMPTKAHASDSGFDLVASADVIIAPGETAVVPTGIAVQLPADYEATVRPRSGVTAKTKLRVQLGTIDNGYNGEIGVIVDNIAEVGREDCGVNYIDGSPEYYESASYLIRKGDRIAQLVITRLPDVVGVEVEDVEITERGAHGFGSSGVK